MDPRTLLARAATRWPRRAAALLAFCRERIAAYKCPRAIDLHAALPRTGSGKIDKRALREPSRAGHDRRMN
jgi:acyl-coenzyme A synthetase/AMP-(fatty) acid ligase